ncbi:MAG TPA: hypothetical protein VIM65_07740 [Cyclobacteriaceae bacterium]
MRTDFEFFRTTMSESREADFYLGCIDGSVFMDFNQSDENLISLSRISFDGYGCCNLNDTINYLNIELSRQFLEEIKKEILNQDKLTSIVKEIIKINRDYIWADALEEYNLIDN